MFRCGCNRDVVRLLDSISRQLAEIKVDAIHNRALLLNVLQQERQIMSLETELNDAVSAETTVDQSIVTLLNGIAAQLAAALASATPDAAVQAAIDGIKANSAAIAAAVTANTPAAPQS